MISLRRCSRSGCGRSAVATLTYDYADSQAVLGPLSQQPEPGAYDLCGPHARRLSVPRGWEVIRLPMEGDEPVQPDPDDLVALADAVREAAYRYDEPPQQPSAPPTLVEGARRGHLRVVADSPQPRD